MERAAHTDPHPQLPWILGALILLGVVSISMSVGDEEWIAAGITLAGVLGLAVVLAVTVWRRHAPDG